MVNGMKTYTATAVCEKDAEVLYISATDFLKLQTSSVVWSGLHSNVEVKLTRMAEAIISSPVADLTISATMNKTVLQPPTTATTGLTSMSSKI